MNNTKEKCPYCGSETVEDYRYIDGYYLCQDCERLFNKDDIEIESMRREVYDMLMNTDEEHPMECDITVGEWEAQGLSGLELPTIDKCFHVASNDTMWFHMYGAKETNVITGEDEDVLWEFDDFDIHDMRAILNELKEQETRTITNTTAPTATLQSRLPMKKNELKWLDTEYIRNDITMQPVLVNDTLWYTLFDSHGYNHLFSTLKGLMDYVQFGNNWGTGIQFESEEEMIKYLEEI